jgi:hypothetical protein
MMLCEYECYRVGGPWIAENPACPIHGSEAQRRDRDLDVLQSKISDAETVEELRELMLEMLNLMRG